MLTDCELAARTRIRAVRVDQNLLLIAEGELPSPGFQVDIRQDPRRIFPPSSTCCAVSCPAASRRSSPHIAMPRRSGSLLTRPW